MNKQSNTIIYCRISDINQAGNDSLEGQELAGRVFAKNRDLVVTEVFTDIYTGSKKRRPGYLEMTAYILANPGKIKYTIIKCIDRFTREGSSEYEMMKKELSVLNVELIDIYGIIQPEINALEHLGVEYPWSRYSPSEVSEGVIASQAKIERRTILTRTVSAGIERTRQGYKTKGPVDGYINKKFRNSDGKKRCIQIPDPERAKYYLKMFDLRASGALTDEDIVKEINNDGFKTKIRNVWNPRTGKIIGHKGELLLTTLQLRKIIRHPIYCGIVCEKWTNNLPIKAQYDGLVSIETFNKANRGSIYVDKDGDNYRILYNYQPDKPVVIKNKDNPVFPWKLVLCDHCGKPFYGSSSRGKSGQYFPSYHCHRDHGRCSYSKEEFEATVLGFFDSICYNPRAMASLEEIVRGKYKERFKDILEQSKQIDSDLNILQVEKDQHVEAFIHTSMPSIRESIEKSIVAIDAKIKVKEENRPRTTTQSSEIDTFLKQVKFTLEHLQKLLENAKDLSIRKALFSLIFDETPKYSDFKFGTPKLSLAFNRFSVSDLTNLDICLAVRREGFEPP
ncbi:MAG: recombinase family protein [Candidatus Paceibacterota bacterium]